ncbi:MAG TPA: hypothetical protein VGG79_02715 [Roseiarcus sp.]
MNVLQRYLRDTVEPTFLDFQHSPHSARLAYQACVAVCHAVDRVTYPKTPGNLRSKWRKKSFEFRIVDMIAHKYKHVVSDDEKEPIEQGKLRLSALVFGKGLLEMCGFNPTAVGEGGIDLHNLYFIIQDAIKFLHPRGTQTAGRDPG